MAAIWTDIYRC